MNEIMKKMFEPSEKVQRMYEAVATFVEEERDLSTIKVSEITSRAGIGKGTAYEYFASKEELLVQATLWLCGRQMGQMIEEISKIEGFREKFFFLLEWLQEHKAYNELLIKSIKGGFKGDCEKLKTSVPEELVMYLRNYISDQINGLFELGYQEGAVKEKNKEKRILIFIGALTQFGFGMMNLEESIAMQMNERQLMEFTYECMIKALN